MKQLLIALTAAWLCAGCTTFVEVDGVKYAALSSRQQRYLIEVSRQTLVKHLAKRLISQKECDYALKNEPNVRITYRGDRYGSAVIMWRTPGRLLEFHYEDDLTARYPVCSLAMRNIPDSERRIQPDKSIPGR